MSETNQRQSPRLILSLPQRLLLLACIFIVCYVITAVLGLFVSKIAGGVTVASVRISTILQDLVLFIVPALATSMIITRRPAEFLCLMGRPKISIVLMVIAAMLAVIPAEEFIVQWNANLSFPEFMSGFEKWARNLEELSQGVINEMLQDTSVASLAVNFLIIGVAAGFSEEILFRGCFQRLLTTGGVNHHVAIWTVAVIFSAMHFQIFGFVPRTLLGAFFGYLLVWTGKLWVPVIAHIFNNSLYVFTAWYMLRQNPGVELENESVHFPVWVAAVGILVFSRLLQEIYKRRT